MTNWHGIFVSFSFGTAFANNLASKANAQALRPTTLLNNVINNKKNIQLWEKLLVLTLAPPTRA